MRALTGAGVLLLGFGCSEAPREDSSAAAPATVTDRKLPAFRESPPERPETLPKPTVVLRDVAREHGITFQFHDDYEEDRFYLPEVMGGGVGWLDYDRDGWLDLFFPNGSVLLPTGREPQLPRDVLFRSRESATRFTEVAGLSGVDGTEYGQGCAVADFDADGFPDLFVSNFGDNVLYHNCGDGTFIPVPSPALQGIARWSTSCAWTDLNHDGLMDVYVVNYMDVHEGNLRACDYDGIPGYCGPGDYESLADEAYLNLGDGGFREASRELGLVDTNGKGLAITVADLDNDLQAEIYVANDMTANHLFSHRRSDDDSDANSPPWSDRAAIAGCGVSEAGVHEASMGVACADFDLDQAPDLYLTHFYHQKNTMYVNSGNLTFRDVSRRFRTTVTSNDFNGFGVVPIDIASDGIPDLFVANGHVLGPDHIPNRMPPQLLANVEGRFLQDVSSDAGPYFERPTLGRGAAGADFDNDGDTDIAVSHIGHPVSLLENATPRKSAGVVGLILADDSRNPPIGGRAELRQGDYRRTWPVTSGGSYLASPDPRLLIPLPEQSTESPMLKIFWTSGHVQEFPAPESGFWWHVREAKPPVRLQPFVPSPNGSARQ